MTDQIVITRHIAASPETVYAFLTDSDKWSLWQGADATIDAQPGGIFSIKMPTGTTARGEFVELIPSEKVVFTWGWIDHPGIPPGSSTVEIEITVAGDGSLVTLTHSGLPIDEVEVHEVGWQHYVPRLASVAEGRAVGPDSGPAG